MVIEAVRPEIKVVQKEIVVTPPPEKEPQLSPEKMSIRRNLIALREHVNEQIAKLDKDKELDVTGLSEVVPSAFKVQFVLNSSPSYRRLAEKPVMPEQPPQG